MNLTKIIIAICSLLFIMIGLDKFFNFLEPPCSLMHKIHPLLWKLLGGIQLIAGILIWRSNYTKIIARFFFVFMVLFTAAHLIHGTYDVGGSVFMAILLGLLIWNPEFISKKLF